MLGWTMTQIPEQGGSEVIKAQLLWPSETSKSQIRVASLIPRSLPRFLPPTHGQLSAINFIFTVTHNRTSCFHLFHFFSVSGVVLLMFSFSFCMVDIQTEMVGGLVDEWGWRGGRLKSMWADVATMLFPFTSRSQRCLPPLDLQRRIFFSDEPERALDETRKAIEAGAA